MGPWLCGSVGPWVSEYMGPSVCGSVGLWVSGYVGPRICGSVGLWVCGSVGLWVCGFVDLWVCGSVDPWVYGYVGPCVYGSVGPWVCGSAGLWVSGYVGLWVCGSVGMWVCGSVGLWARVFVGLGRLFQSVHTVPPRFELGTFSTTCSHFLLSFVSNQLRTQCTVSGNLNEAGSLCTGPIGYMGSRDYTWYCRPHMEPTGSIWQLSGLYPCAE